MTANLLSGIDKIVKFSAQLQGICGVCYIDSKKLICVAFTRRSNRFLSTLKDGVPLNKKIYISGPTVKKELAIDTTFDQPLFSSDYTFNYMEITPC